MFGKGTAYGAGEGGLDVGAAVGAEVGRMRVVGVVVVVVVRETQWLSIMLG